MSLIHSDSDSERGVKESITTCIGDGSVWDMLRAARSKVIYGLFVYTV